MKTEHIQQMQSEKMNDQLEKVESNKATTTEEKCIRYHYALFHIRFSLYAKHKSRFMCIPNRDQNKRIRWRKREREKKRAEEKKNENKKKNIWDGLVKLDHVFI